MKQRSERDGGREEERQAEGVRTSQGGREAGGGGGAGRDEQRTGQADSGVHVSFLLQHGHVHVHCCIYMYLCMWKYMYMCILMCE